jgi:sensor histidine kinase regulating citrate/malate metabolism
MMSKPGASDPYHKIFDSAVIGLAIVELDGRVRAINRTMCDMFGHTPDGLVGHLFPVARWISYITENVDRMQRLIDDLLARDNGIGFDAAYSSQIFEIFRRLHSDVEYEGTGIGLALCRRIVERHGGQIWADSVVGEGSTSSFTLSERHELKS